MLLEGVETVVFVRVYAFVVCVVCVCVGDKKGVS